MGFNWAEFAGNAVSGMGSPSLQHHANQTNKEQNWEFFSANERLQNNAHQREVADLKLAGLNPILSATGGSGAGAPSGGSQSLVAPEINMPDLMAYGISLKQLEQKDIELGQGQQKVNNDTDLTKSTMVKNLTDNELKKLEALQTKQGLVGKMLGTEQVEKATGFLKDAGKGADQLIHKGVKELIRRVKTPQKLMSTPPSSGGEIPGF